MHRLFGEQHWRRGPLPQTWKPSVSQVQAVMQATSFEPARPWQVRRQSPLAASARFVPKAVATAPTTPTPSILNMLRREVLLAIPFEISSNWLDILNPFAPM